MCGILGIITNSKDAIHDKRCFIAQGLIIDTLRGDDGAGLFAVPFEQNLEERNGAAYWIKMEKDGYSLTQTKEFVDIMSDMNKYRAIVAHNRSATVGLVDQDTAHPFQEGPITLVHNGTLDSTANLKLSQFQAKALSDSHTICHNLAISTDVKETLESLQGSYALVWHDARDDSVNIARNEKRPLWISKFMNSETLCFASEPDMIRWLDRRNTINLLDILPIKAGTWIKFKPGQFYNPETVTFQPEKPVSRHNGRYVQHSNESGTGSGRGPVVVMDKWLKKGHKRKKERNRVDNIVSEAHAKSLEILGIPQDELLPFVAADILSTRNGPPYETHSVLGYTISLADGKRGLPVLLTNVSENTWANARARVWSVRPRAVNWAQPSCPLVIGSLVNTIGPDSTNTPVPQPLLNPWNYLWTPQAIRPVVADENDDDEEDPVFEEYEERMYKGAHGIWVPLDTWLIQTKNGCIECGQCIEPKDSDAIEWMNDRRDPMCLDCLDTLTRALNIQVTNEGGLQ